MNALFMTVATLQHWSEMGFPKTIWPTKPRIFTIWPFIGSLLVDGLEQHIWLFG